MKYSAKIIEPNPPIPDMGRWVEGGYEPSQEEIRLWCEHFQRCWGERDRYFRRHGIYVGENDDVGHVQPHRWRTTPGNRDLIAALEDRVDD